MSGRRSASATAYWNGPALTYVRNCFVVRTAATNSRDPVTQPTFQPVKEKVLPAEEMETVRSRMPGREIRGVWAAPSNVRCS